MKKCKLCGQERSLEEFSPKRFASGNMGHQWACKVCLNDAGRDKAREDRRAQRAADPEAFRKYAREYTRARRATEEGKKERQEIRRRAAERKGKAYRTAQERGINKGPKCTACPECFRNKAKNNTKQCATTYWFNYITKKATPEWKAAYYETKRLISNGKKKIYFKNRYEETKEYQRNRVREYKWANPDKVKKWGDKRWQLISENWDGTLTRKEVFNLLHEYKKCPYCNRELTDANKELDHMEPVTLGGMHSKYNVVVCCSDCNGAKSGKSFIQWITPMDNIRRQGLMKMFERKKKAMPVQLTFANEWMASAGP